MQTINENTAIANFIHSYGDAFNAADIARTVSLFTADGILMPNNAPLSHGKEQLTAAFKFLLNTFRISIVYSIDEITVSGGCAVVRTNSKVATHVNASDENISLNNKELFILRKEQDDWKISHYIFNNTSVSK